MKNTGTANSKSARSLPEILAVLVILVAATSPLWSQMAVRVDNETKQISEPTGFWDGNPVPLDAMTNGLSGWTGNTNIATSAQGALADTALQPGTAITNISGLAAALSARAEIVTAPASATNAGLPGQIATDGVYFYFCTGTNTWGRFPLSTW